MVISERLHLSTKGHADIINITDDIAHTLSGLSINNGIVNISVVGSTSALTTCEYEPGLEQDLKDLFNHLIPPGSYNHDQAWGDGNGHSHLCASLLGPSLTFPFNNRKMILGTWQQIIYIDFDNRPRQREIVLQFIGE
ncbi:MAG: secondary thiamine-phosphate synthase enzyme YjbQ [Candidatus Omnitrophica bacterium]|nr:secondary thiamine-phosphate synthase enzyme YjbQ [Candidatus Omnitrophota bacterium]